MTVKGQLVNLIKDIRPITTHNRKNNYLIFIHIEDNSLQKDSILITFYDSEF